MYRTHKTETALLREYIKSAITENDDVLAGGGGAGSGDVYGPSFGTGEDLFNTFIGPSFEALKTVFGKSKEIVQHTKTLLFVALQTTLTTLIPIYGYNYASVFDEEKKKIDKIRDEYKDIYANTDRALKSGDAGMLAFMASPALALGAISAAKGPAVAKAALSGITGGLSDDLYNKVKEKAIKAGRWSLGEDESKKESLANIGTGRLFEDDKSGAGMITPADILNSKKFINNALDNPAVAKLQKLSTEIYKTSLGEIYAQAENVLQKATTIDDLEKFAKKKIPEADKLRSLQGDEKSKAEKMLITGIRKTMKDFYIKNLTDQVNSVIAAGVPESVQYVKDYREVIQKIKKL